MWVNFSNKLSQSHKIARQPYGPTYKKYTQEEKSEKVNTHKQAPTIYPEAKRPNKIRQGKITPMKSEQIFVEHLQQIVNILTNTSNLDYFLDLRKQNMFCESQRRVGSFIIGEYDRISQQIIKNMQCKLRLAEMMKSKITFKQQKQTQRNPIYSKRLNEIVHYANSLKILLAIYKQKDISLWQLQLSALSPSHRQFLKQIHYEKLNSPKKSQTKHIKPFMMIIKQHSVLKIEHTLDEKRNLLLSNLKKERGPEIILGRYKKRGGTSVEQHQDLKNVRRLKVAISKKVDSKVRTINVRISAAYRESHKGSKIKGENIEKHQSVTVQPTATLPKVIGLTNKIIRPAIINGQYNTRIIIIYICLQQILLNCLMIILVVSSVKVQHFFAFS